MRAALLFFLFSFSMAVRSQCISTYPFTEDFEASNGNWAAFGAGIDWEWGAPTKPVISASFSGNNCWVAGTLNTSFYTYGERSYIQSPCFDFSSLQFPSVSFAVFWECEKGFDGANFQSSVDGGVSWQNVGGANEPGNCMNANWFNTANINNLSGLVTNREGWSGNIQASSGSCVGGNGSGGWLIAKHCMANLAGEPDVIFRFTFGAGTQCNNYDGFAIDDFTIREAPANTASISASCIGNNTYAFTATVNQCPDGLLWNFGDGSTATGATASHTYSASGVYNVSFTATGPCNAAAVATQAIEVIGVNVDFEESSCAATPDGKAFITNPQTGFAYAWSTSPAQFSDTAFNLAAGEYTITVTKANACSATASVTVTQASSPSVASALVMNDTCFQGTGMIAVLATGGTAPYIYAWSNGAQTNTLSGVNAGSYALTVTDDKSCSASAAYTILNVSGLQLEVVDRKDVSCLATKDGSATVRVRGGDSPYQYQWSGSSSDSVLRNAAVGFYSVTVNDSKGCADSLTVEIEKEVCESYIYFPTAFSPNGDNANDFFRPKYSSDLKSYSIAVYNRWGELVYTSSNVNEGWDGFYKGVAQPVSTYIWSSQFSFLNGPTEQRSGNVTLVR
jgi:gliding motility-associated-like protein